MNREGLKPPSLFLLGLLGTATISLLDPAQGSLGTAIAGVTLILVGLGLNVVASGQFAREGIDIRPGSRSRRLAKNRLFAISRNPMYLGMVLALAGASAALGTALGLVVPALFVAVVTQKFIRPEEAHLEATFGEEYLQYSARVRRWI